MTKRERYLRALRNEKVDALVWAPNADFVRVEMVADLIKTGKN